MHTLAPRKARAAEADTAARSRAKARRPGADAASGVGLGRGDAAVDEAPDAANVPSVVVEGVGERRRCRRCRPIRRCRAEPVRGAAEAAPLPPPPSVEPTHKRKNDPTGEWFSSDSQPIRTIAGRRRTTTISTRLPRAAIARRSSSAVSRAG